MNKQDYEMIIKKLQQEKDNLEEFVFKLRNHIDTNLQPLPEYKCDVVKFKVIKDSEGEKLAEDEHI